jgi:murein DD-endopeptidase MepM/ murein hydrolase activator NlpD
MMPPTPGPITPHGEWLEKRDSKGYSPTGTRQHAGVDVKVKQGQKVVAPEGGLVEDVRHHPAKGSGFGGYGPNILLIQGSSGVYHLLAHLSSVLPPFLKKGAQVVEGEQVGTGSGAYGHVHWEVRATPASKGTANVFDPVAWLAGELVTREPGMTVHKPNRKLPKLPGPDLPVGPIKPPPVPRVPSVPSLPGGGTAWILLLLALALGSSGRRG